MCVGLHMPVFLNKITLQVQYGTSIVVNIKEMMVSIQMWQALIIVNIVHHKKLYSPFGAFLFKIRLYSKNS